MQYFLRKNRIYISNASLQQISRLENITSVGQACLASPSKVDVYVTVPNDPDVRVALDEIQRAA